MIFRISCLMALILTPVLPHLAVGFVEDVRWLEENQLYDLVLNPETIPAMTGYQFQTYNNGEEKRLVISDRHDGLWRVNEDLVLFQSAGPVEPGADMPGDQHTLSFDKAKNILIEGLDIYAHEVEEALKFSSCANIAVRNCRVIASRTSEDAIDIVRGQNYLFDGVWIIGLGDRGMTIKGSARFVDIIDSHFGLKNDDDFYEVFNATEITVGDRTYQMGSELLPKKIVPDWALICLLFTGDRALGVEIGGWSDYDIGYINADGILQSPRPLTSDIRIEAEFTDGMNGDCDRRRELIGVLQWHTAERVIASQWIFNPTNTSVFGDLVEDIYYKESVPSAKQEAEIRDRLGEELNYWGFEFPRYVIQPGSYSNNRFFGPLYNHDGNFLYSPFIGWFYMFQDGPVDHELMRPGNSWLYHYPTASWYLFLGGDTLSSAMWWNLSDGNYYHGILEPYASRQ